MQLTFSRIEVKPDNNNPCDALQRTATQRWLVATSPIDLTGKTQWSLCEGKHTVYVPVPMVPYLTGAEPSDSLGFAVQLGVAVAQQLYQNNISRLHISLGYPCCMVQRDGVNVLRFYCGFAALLQ